MPLDFLPFHWDGGNNSTSLEFNDLPRECIDDCSHSGSCDADVQHWRKSLNFSVNREMAMRYLISTGGWDKDDLRDHSDEDLAEKILWLACGTFKDYLAECESKELDPLESPETNCGSSFFTLEA